MNHPFLQLNATSSQEMNTGDMLFMNENQNDKINLVDVATWFKSMDSIGGNNEEQEKLEKPKRPLSSYNIFFRFERARILQDVEKNRVTIERHDDGTIDIVYENEDLARPKLNLEDVRHVVRTNTNTQKRQHRRTHGKIGFTELIKYMCKAWAKLDKDSREVFEKLAAEEKEKYAKKLQTYKVESQKLAKKQQTQKMNETRIEMLNQLLNNANSLKKASLPTAGINVNPLIGNSSLMPSVDQLLNSLKYSLSYQRNCQQGSSATHLKNNMFSLSDSMTPSQRRLSILHEALNDCDTSATHIKKASSMNRSDKDILDAVTSDDFNCDSMLPLHIPKPASERSISILQEALNCCDSSVMTPSSILQKNTNTINAMLPTNQDLSEVIGKDDDIFTFATVPPQSKTNKNLEDALRKLKRSYACFSNNAADGTDAHRSKKTRCVEEEKDLATFLMDFDWKRI